MAEILEADGDALECRQLLSRFVVPVGAPPLDGEGEALSARRFLAESPFFCREKDYAAALGSIRRRLGLFGGNPPLSPHLARALRAEGNALMKDGGPEDSRAALNSFEREVSVRSRIRSRGGRQFPPCPPVSRR
ncbi:MAG: hypothetical protein LBQ12_03640 [Deltaproteobacteria bacterium]|jgi:hypothetical protein|nr:hypothetical protein [Deltaproteobacteria bacterium]